MLTREPEENRALPVKQIRSLSRLEALPAELIENIFLECLEFNLPRASVVLAASLSREALYRALILYAFWNDPLPGDHDQDIPATRAVSRLFRPLDYVPIGERERFRLQEAIWNCRWCTFGRLKGCLRDFVNLSLHRWLYGHGKHANGLQVDSSDMEALTDGLENRAFSWTPSIGDGKPRSVICETGMGDATLWIDPWSVQSFRSQIGKYPIEALVFPDKLLRGSPWSNEKIELFEFLRTCLPGYAAIEFDDGEPATLYSDDKLQDGIHAAIVEHNPRALRNLLELNSTYADFTLRIQMTSVSKSVNPHHIMTAIHMSDDSAIMKLLVRGNLHSIPCDDPEITAWAMRLEEQGDPFGKFLLHLMEELPTYQKDGASINGGLLLNFDGSTEATRLFIQAYGGSETWYSELLHDYPPSLEDKRWTLTE